MNQSKPDHSNNMHVQVQQTNEESTKRSKIKIEIQYSQLSISEVSERIALRLRSEDQRFGGPSPGCVGISTFIQGPPRRPSLLFYAAPGSPPASVSYVISGERVW